MTLTDFINKWNGKYLSVLTPTSKQCFDAVVGWTDNLGVPHFTGNPSPFPYPNACQIYANFGNFQAQYFTQFPNPPVGGPKEGDIVVWAYAYNYAGGHTGVATGKGVSTGASTDWFECFEQNDPTGHVCQLKNYGFGNVLGWLRPKNYGTPLTCDQKLSQIKTWQKDTNIKDSDFRYKVGQI